MQRPTASNSNISVWVATRYGAACVQCFLRHCLSALNLPKSKKESEGCCLFVNVFRAPSRRYSKRHCQYAAAGASLATDGETAMTMPVVERLFCFSKMPAEQLATTAIHFWRLLYGCMVEGWLPDLERQEGARRIPSQFSVRRYLWQSNYFVIQCLIRPPFLAQTILTSSL
jgi:hypothetical protein